MESSPTFDFEIENVFLVESHFKREAEIPEDMQLKLAFRVKNSIRKERGYVATEVEAELNQESDAIHALVIFIAIFSTSIRNNERIKDFAKYSSPSILFPYIREELHSRFLKADLSEYAVMPPVSFPQKEAEKPSSKKKTKSLPK